MENVMFLMHACLPGNASQVGKSGTSASNGRPLFSEQWCYMDHS